MTDLQACHALLTRLDAGGKVTLSEVREAIGSSHASSMNVELEHAAALKGEAQNASNGLRDYIEQIRVADLFNGRSESAKSASVGRSLLQKAESRYEHALERLQELLQFDSSLERHLDRPMDLGNEGGFVAPDVEAVPRIKYHARANGKHTHKGIPSRVELMRSALQAAIADPITTASAQPEPSQQQLDEQRAMLKAKFKALRSV